MSQPLTDQEMDAAAPSAAAGTGANAPTSAPLTDEQMDALGAHTPMGTGEATGRLFYKHLTFGTQPFADREKAEQAAQEHPFADLVTGAGAMAAQTAALGPLAWAARGVEGAAMLPTAIRGAGKALEYTMLPNTAADTALTTGRTAAKLAGNYSAAEAAGSDLTSPDKTWGQTAQDVGTAYAVGTALGAPLGVGLHGASRLVGAGLNRALPALREVREAATAPEAQGMRDIARHARYDDADLTRLEQTLSQADSDPAIAARYQDLNLLEALKAAEPAPIGGTGELKPPVVTTRNLDDLAKHAANTEGRGQNIAAEAFGSRKNEMSAKIQADVDRYFGSGNREADEAALQTQKEALSRRYERLRAKPLQKVDDIGRVAQAVPEFNAALQYASKNDMIRLAESGAEWRTPWSAETLGEGLQTLSPTNILDIHHALVMNAKPPIGGPTPESIMAGRLKNWFSNWVDNQFRGHKDLRQDYAQFRRTMEAQEKASALPLNTGGRDHPSLQFFDAMTADHDQAARSLGNRIAQYDTAMEKFNAGQRKTQPKASDLQKGIDDLEGRRAIIDAFRKTWGERFKQELAQAPDPNNVIRRALTQEGKARILQILGPENGKAFIESLYNKQLQTRLGNTLYGGSDTAFKLKKGEKMEALTDAVHGALHLRPLQTLQALRELGSSHYRQMRADQLNELLSQQGVENLKSLLASLNAQNALRTTAHPYVRNPFLRTLGPLGTTARLPGYGEQNTP